MADLVSHDQPAEYLTSKYCEATILPAGRTKLVRAAQEATATHILWCDTDMKFTPAAVRSLIARDVDIVAADYRKRLAPHDTVAEYKDGSKVPVGAGIVEVHHAGMGLMLTRTTVFEQIPTPWFDYVWGNGDVPLGEDVYFCRKARANGFQVFIDRDASKEVGHVGKQVF